MPDRTTVYGTDDGTDVMFSMFKATKKGDLSDGELFCARMQQETPLPPKEGEEAGSASNFMASIRWMSMGKAKDADVMKALTDWNSTKTGFKFSTLFKTGEVKDGKCEEGYTMIKAGGC